jgi:hypothetical protein
MPIGNTPVWTKETNMNLLPVNDGWTDDGSEITPTLSSGIMNVDDNSGSGNYAVKIAVGLIDDTKTTRYVNRIRVNSSTSVGWITRLNDGTKRISVSLNTNSVALEGGTTTVMDMTIFRKVRVEMVDTTRGDLYIDDVLVDSVLYADLSATADNEFTMATSTNGLSNLDVDYSNYQLDLAANPNLVGDWVADVTYPEFLSAEVVTANTYLVADSHLFKPKPETSNEDISWKAADWVRTDRVDDNTIVIYVRKANVEEFDFELVIIKDKASIT